MGMKVMNDAVRRGVDWGEGVEMEMVLVKPRDGEGAVLAVAERRGGWLVMAVEMVRLARETGRKAEVHSTARPRWWAMMASWRAESRAAGWMR